MKPKFQIFALTLFLIQSVTATANDVRYVSPRSLSDDINPVETVESRDQNGNIQKALQYRQHATSNYLSNLALSCDQISERAGAQAPYIETQQKNALAWVNHYAAQVSVREQNQARNLSQRQASRDQRASGMPGINKIFVKVAGALGDAGRGIGNSVAGTPLDAQYQGSYNDFLSLQGEALIARQNEAAASVLAAELRGAEERIKASPRVSTIDSLIARYSAPEPNRLPSYILTAAQSNAALKDQITGLARRHSREFINVNARMVEVLTYYKNIAAQRGFPGGTGGRESTQVAARTAKPVKTATKPTTNAAPKSAPKIAVARVVDPEPAPAEAAPSAAETVDEQPAPRPLARAKVQEEPTAPPSPDDGMGNLGPVKNGGD